MDIVWTGSLKKMRVEAAGPVRYFLTDGWFEKEKRETDYLLNTHLGSSLELRFTGEINCIACGRKVKKTFGQGYCFPCTRSLPEADICIIKPELCHHGEKDNPCRDENFAREVCFHPHYLYCSLTSGVKVGITREVNIPSRWIDQGAVAAVPVALLPNRRAVGEVEKRLSDEGFKDKTHWTRMLKGNPEDRDLMEVVDRVVERLTEWGTEGILSPLERLEHRFEYPVQEWPVKVSSLNLDKNPVAGGVLQDIKAQYLIFDSGVINLRKYSGYKVEVAAG